MKLPNCHGKVPYVSVPRWRGSIKMSTRRYQAVKSCFRKPEQSKEHIRECFKLVFCLKIKKLVNSAKIYALNILVRGVLDMITSKKQ